MKRYGKQQTTGNTVRRRIGNVLRSIAGYVEKTFAVYLQMWESVYEFESGVEPHKTHTSTAHGYTKEASVGRKTKAGKGVKKI